jgi:hypothetical protein
VTLLSKKLYLAGIFLGMNFLQLKAPASNITPPQASGNNVAAAAGVLANENQSDYAGFLSPKTPSPSYEAGAGEFTEDQFSSAVGNGSDVAMMQEELAAGGMGAETKRQLDQMADEAQQGEEDFPLESGSTSFASPPSTQSLGLDSPASPLTAARAAPSPAWAALVRKSRLQDISSDFAPAARESMPQDDQELALPDREGEISTSPANISVNAARAQASADLRVGLRQKSQQRAAARGAAGRGRE